MGAFYRKSDPLHEPPDMWYLDWLTWLIPDKLYRLHELCRMSRDLCRYTPHKAMEDLDAESVFVGDVLCVGSKARRMGLGSELVRRSRELAEGFGSEVYFVKATGVRSQALFDKAGFNVLREYEYDKILDKYGRILINDAREHKVVKTMFVRLNGSK